MRGRGRVRRMLVVGIGMSATAMVGVCSGETHSPKVVGTCRRAFVEGSVNRGEEFVRPIGEGLKVSLEPLGWGSGWVLRVLPVSGPRPANDYAGLATPPYDSVNPLLISTDFSFRAQDAVGWNPRQFRFVTNVADFARLQTSYDRYMAGGAGNTSVVSELAEAVSHAPAGVFQILDAKLVPGTANQSKMASAVASHFSTTAHTVEEPVEGKGSPLGRMTWVRFRVVLDLPKGFRVDPGMTLSPEKCR
jgi:hypothetical protein